MATHTSKGQKMQNTSLTTDQIISIVGDIAVPTSIFLVGIIVSLSIERLKRQMEHKNFIIEKQFETYQVLGRKLNTLLQYCTYVGSWKNNTPDEVINIKREIDTIFFSASPILSDSVAQAYNGFISACFDVKLGKGTQIKIKANYERFEKNSNWKPEWREYFVDPVSLKLSSGSYRRDVVQVKYSELMAAFSSLLVGRRGIKASSLATLIAN